MSVSPRILDPEAVALTTLDLAGIAWRIRRLRWERGWSQSDLGAATGAARATVSRWERAHCAPDVETLCRLADAFECSLDYIVRGRGGRT